MGAGLLGSASSLQLAELEIIMFDVAASSQLPRLLYNGVIIVEILLNC